MPTGRRDGRISQASQVNLPGPTMSVAQATSAFTAKGLSQNDMVTLLGTQSTIFITEASKNYYQNPCSVILNAIPCHENEMTMIECQIVRNSLRVDKWGVHKVVKTRIEVYLDIYMNLGQFQWPIWCTLDHKTTQTWWLVNMKYRHSKLWLLYCCFHCHLLILLSS